MRKRHLKLRTLLTATIAIVVTVSVGISLALVAFSHRHRAASHDLADAVETLRLADDAKTELLLHGRTHDPVVRRDMEARLRRALIDLGTHVTTDKERAGLERASSGIHRYLDASYMAAGSHQAVPELEPAYEALEALVAMNVEQARDSRSHVERWNTSATILAFAVSALLLLLAGWFVWWLWVRALRPVAGLLQSMDRFGRGDRDARAEEDGPAELQSLARRFNDVASALAAQRQTQMSFLGGVAHDIRNPLAALRMGMANARRRATSDGSLARFFDLTERQVARIERLLDDLIDTAKIEAGKLDLRLEWRDVNGIVREMVASFEASSPAHRLVAELPADPVMLSCDPVRLEQVLSNLLTNAVKYSPEGGTVMVELVRQRGEISIAVTDQGIGISAEDHALLFQPFRRVGSSSGAIPGTGLGLFVVRQIVSAHGGSIEVISSRGAGSTFRVRLPSADGRPAVRVGASSPAPVA